MDDVECWVFKQAPTIPHSKNRCPFDPGGLHEPRGCPKSQGPVHQAPRLGQAIGLKPPFLLVKSTWILPFSLAPGFICFRRSGQKQPRRNESQELGSLSLTCTCRSPKECIYVVCSYQFLSRFSCHGVNCQPKVIHSNSATCELKDIKGHHGVDLHYPIVIHSTAGPESQMQTSWSQSCPNEHRWRDDDEITLSSYPRSTSPGPRQETATGHHGNEKKELEALLQSKHAAWRCAAGQVECSPKEAPYEVEKGKAWSAGLCSPKNGARSKTQNLPSTS